ncbi:Chlorovirus glycoprotein repeat domain-containing protein, partial [Acanthocystis turfacea Chlorella virus MN0810.1]
MSYFLTPWEYHFNNIVADGNVTVGGQVNVLGNIYAQTIYGNVQGNVIAQLPAVGSIDVRGNVIGMYANMSQIIGESGNIGNVTLNNSNVTAEYYFGNGSQLVGVTSTLPSVSNLDIHNGNIIGSYANVSNIIATFGNVANVILSGGNVAASGQINTLGNVVAPFFIGNGSQLTGITLPGIANLDIHNGNIIGSYANVSNIIATFGNIANVRLSGGNVAVSGQINTLGNVVAPFFVGNGSQLAGISLPGTANLDILNGNITGNTANVVNINATNGNIANVRLSGGNVTALYYFGNGSQLTGISLPGTANLDIRNGNIIGLYANVSNIIATFGNIANVILAGGNVAVSGQINALGNVVAPFFIGNGSQLTGISLPGIANLDIHNGNIIGSYA